MPFLRISLQKGRSPEEICRIAETVHTALARSFNVPLKDRFQVVHQHEPHEFYADPEYMGVQRTSGLLFIQVFAGKPRSVETKRAFFRDLCDSLAASCAVSPDDVFVVISTSGAEDWSFGRGLVQMLDAAPV